MTESKFKRIVSAITVGAVLLLVILLSVLVYQLISIGVRNRQIDEINAEIAVYERMIERRARELGYKLPSDLEI